MHINYVCAFPQVLLHSNFKSFPAEALTVEFWMLSSDSCRSGAPYSLFRSNPVLMVLCCTVFHLDHTYKVTKDKIGFWMEA